MRRKAAAACGRSAGRIAPTPYEQAACAAFRWKDLRHTFATRLRLKGSDTGTIRDLLGHTSDRMTKRYAHASAGHLLAAVQRISETGDTGATLGAICPDTSIDDVESDRVNVGFGR